MFVLVKFFKLVANFIRLEFPGFKNEHFIFNIFTSLFFKHMI